ncbi:probable C-terminal domain small phosphatase [Eucalyptus grandis]|uniref:probable C-terminal domain small phosphatase n=1 Tax=Eucalyptus grandis TaxID=71139 RepID=UPI00192EB89A|nr:probable C-terminal domain small phosphatase [Eucalyptus grandis]
MAVTNATENKNVEKLFQVQTAEKHVSHVDKEIEAASNCNGEASVNSGLVSLCEHSNGNGAKVNRQIDEGNPLSELLVSEDDIKSDININKGSMPRQIPDISSERTSVEPSRKKLLILDLNGLLASIIPDVGLGCKPDLIVSRKAVFKRPFVDDFVQFCFEKFAVGVWSSRTKRNVDPVVDFLMGDSKGKLLFCWDQSHCTITKFTTIENRDKPLVLKELRKLWDKLEPNLPWEKGVYNESNTLLLDDSPYKALRNPANTGIFPYSYRYTDAKDNSLGPGGDLRVYLESLALADDVRKYVEQNPFGQRAITNSNPSWNYYKRVLASDPSEDANSILK